jgi:hypothetical protein
VAYSNAATIAWGRFLAEFTPHSHRGTINLGSRLRLATSPHSLFRIIIFHVASGMNSPIRNQGLDLALELLFAAR